MPCTDRQWRLTSNLQRRGSPLSGTVPTSDAAPDLKDFGVIWIYVNSAVCCHDTILQFIVPDDYSGDADLVHIVPNVLPYFLVPVSGIE